MFSLTHSVDLVRQVEGFDRQGEGGEYSHLKMEPRQLKYSTFTDIQ